MQYERLHYYYTNIYYNFFYIYKHVLFSGPRYNWNRHDLRAVATR